MNRRSIEDVKDGLHRLMQEHIDSLEQETFVQHENHDEERLTRIREISAEYLALLDRSLKKIQEKDMPHREKPSVTLPGKVEKVIEPLDPDEPERAEIKIEGADPLYREIRIENSLKDKDGHEVRLEENDNVDITLKADKDVTASDRPSRRDAS